MHTFALLLSIIFNQKCLVSQKKRNVYIHFPGCHYLLNCNSVPVIPNELPVGCDQFNLNSNIIEREPALYFSIFSQSWPTHAYTHALTHSPVETENMTQGSFFRMTCQHAIQTSSNWFLWNSILAPDGPPQIQQADYLLTPFPSCALSPYDKESKRKTPLTNNTSPFFSFPNKGWCLTK